MIKKLKRKFVFFFMLTVTLMLLVIFGMILHFTRTNYETESIRTMQNIGRKPRTVFTPELPSDEMRFPYFTLLLDEDGSLSSVEGEYYDLSDKEFLQKLIDTVLSSSQESGILREYSLRYCVIWTPVRGQNDTALPAAPGLSSAATTVTPTQDQSASTAPAVMPDRIVFADISGEMSTLRSLLRICILVGFLCLCLFLLLSLFLARWAVRPLEQAWEQQRQFVSDASHELKTPLTVILTNAEMLQDTSPSEAERTSLSANILTMAKQMRGLVENLLELARMDNGALTQNFCRTDFSSLLSDSLLPFEPLYYEKGLSLHTTLEPSLFVNGNPEYLTQLINILLDNAQKYALPASTVTVCLQRTGKNCLLSIENAGETISPADLKKIFQRFYRMDQARSMNHSYGLGLAIAQSIVQKHKGKIWCTSQTQHITFYVSLPLQEHP